MFYFDVTLWWCMYINNNNKKINFSGLDCGGPWPFLHLNDFENVWQPLSRFTTSVRPFIKLSQDIIMWVYWVVKVRSLKWDLFTFAYECICGYVVRNIVSINISGFVFRKEVTHLLICLVSYIVRIFYFNITVLFFESQMVPNSHSSLTPTFSTTDKSSVFSLHPEMSFMF